MQTSTATHQDSEVIVERDFHLDSASEPAIKDAIEGLLSVPGIQEAVRLTGRRPGLRLSYDTRKIDAARIGELIGESGLHLASGLLERWRMGWMNMLDDNIRDNAKHRAACCSRPPPGAGKGLKRGK